MILDILKNAEATWRDIASLATPLDADKEVVIGSKTKSHSDFEAYTDNKKIYININNEKKFQKNFENIVVPAYKIAASRLYDVPNQISESELLINLIFDTFLFIHLHEQLHPWLCPNSKYDEKTITKTLYDGIKEAEPMLSKAEVLYKVNNCKNLIWDTVLNISFVSKTSNSDDKLEQKIEFVFAEKNRKIEFQPVTHYPSGILPIVYMTSAQNRTTDIPISLIGAMYATLSYNDSGVRQKAIDVFLEDLENKKIDEKKALGILKDMYNGFISEINNAELLEKGIDKTEYRKRISTITDFANPDYEDNQRYFVSSLTNIFDTPSMRYASLKGFVKVLSPYISLKHKQGSPDPNTMGHGSPGGSGDQSEEEMNGDSMAQTLDDLLGTLDEDEADELMGEVANDDMSGRKKGPSSNIRKKISIISADEFYKKNADIIEVQNPSQENVSYDLGKKERWKLVKSQTLTAVRVSTLNHQKIMAFQRATGLPVLMEIGNGFYKFNEYRLEESPLKSYSSQKTGIEIPDNWVLFQDSSGSMTTSTSYVGSGNKFDLLNRVKYGIKKGLYHICKEMGKDLLFGVVDFSDSTLYKGLDSLVKIYEARTHPIKEVSLTPQCGDTFFNSKVFDKIKKDSAPGKTIYTFITDGDIHGNTAPLFDAVEKFSSDPQNAFLFIEIASKSRFGEQIKDLSKKNPSVMYERVRNVSSIKDKLSSVLIRYS